MLRRFVVRVALCSGIACGLLVAPAASDAQRSVRVHRVGVLHSGFFPASPAAEGLKAGLKTLGLEEGRDVTFDIRFTRGKLEASPTIAAALVSAGVDLLFTIQEPDTRAAASATQTIPIVFTGVGDPVAAGIVRSIAHPGRNATGVSNLATELVPKRLEILKALAPSVRRVWAVYHADDHSAVSAAQRAEQVAAALKLEVLMRPVRTADELVTELRAVRPTDALLAPSDRAMNIPGLILDLERDRRASAIFASTFWVEAGALVAYGSDEYEDGVQAARLVARILRGAKPKDLPVEAANKIELALNLKTAERLGLAIPRDVLSRANRVIE
jgi:putative tryptophan/tyrosine transport system substrate-binding protein